MARLQKLYCQLLLMDDLMLLSVRVFSVVSSNAMARSLESLLQRPERGTQPFGTFSSRAKILNDCSLSFHFQRESLRPSGKAAIFLLESCNYLLWFAEFPRQGRDKMHTFVKRSFQFFDRRGRCFARLRACFELLTKLFRLLQKARVYFALVYRKISWHVRAIDALAQRLEAFRHKRFTEKSNERLQSRFRLTHEVGVSHTKDYSRAIRAFRQRTIAYCGEPILIGFLRVGHQTLPGDTVEVQHRSNHRNRIAEHVDELRVGKKLAQSANVKRVLRRAIDPTCLRVIRGDETAVGRVRAGGVSPPFSLKIDAVAENQLGNGFAEAGEKFRVVDAHRTQERVIVARGSNLIVNSEIDGQVSHPAGFFERNDIRMPTQAPSKDACAGPWRADYENRSIFLVLHLT